MYQQDVTILEFEAVVVERINLDNGRIGILLNRSYFYPTSGGQEHDTGKIGSATVVDVYKSDNSPNLVHVIEGELGTGIVHACIDADRRLRHMQHHTAQHLLTQCILRQAGYETVSANINGYSPSTLDIIADQISKADLDLAEQMANQVIYENRPVKTYFVTPEELQSIPLRRPPKVNENIRIVEIDSYDYSACGGTHVLQTGSIGLIKVLKTERQNNRQRVHFVAGLQAMDIFHQMFDALTGMANSLSMGWQDIPLLVSKQVEQLGTLQKELQTMRQSALRYEASELASAAEDRQGVKWVRAGFTNRPISELRVLAEELRKMPGVVASLASFDGQKISLIVTCGEGSQRDARQLLTSQLMRINGRGGGDARLAQGGGAATLQEYESFLQKADLE